MAHAICAAEAAVAALYRDQAAPRAMLLAKLRAVLLQPGLHSVHLDITHALCPRKQKCQGPFPSRLLALAQTFDFL